MAEKIDGKAIAAKIRGEISESVNKLKKEKGINPKLAVVLVGDDPASQTYVKMKEKACREVGVEEETYRMPKVTKEEAVLKKVRELNSNKGIHGILVQLPLPEQISPAKALKEVSPEKDVDGLHIENMGKLLRGEEPYFMPCTPSGIMELIKSTDREIKGAEVVVVGRSNIVGKPIALMLLAEHATVTICHSRTKDLGAVCRRADILIAAVGKPKIIKGDMIKHGAVIIDVGVNRTEEGLVGDVDYEEAQKKCSYITPVPGGVGPMTIAMLLKNTLTSAERSAKGH